MFNWNDVYVNSCVNQRVTELQKDINQHKKRFVFPLRKGSTKRKEKV
ncbi:hypothetical protein [Halalkalibacter akibai]|nr:hypothetical protein [Halalkalibacter akibai]